MPAPRQRDIARKDGITMTDLQTPYGGELNPKQFDSFIQLIQAEPTLPGDCRVEILDQASAKLEFAGFSGRISYPVDEYGELSDEQKAKLTTNKVSFACKTFAAAVPISDSVRRNNLMRDQLGGYVMTEMARQVSMDMEDYAVNSDPDSVDLYYTALDGLIVQATSHVIDNTADPQNVDDELFYTMRLALPSKYWRDMPNMRFYCNPKTEAAYAYILRERPSSAGDIIREGNPRDRLTFLGVPLRVVPSMPENTVILTHRNNIVFGIEESVTYETERVPGQRASIFHLHYSFDCKYGVEDAVVLYQGINTTFLPTD